MKCIQITLEIEDFYYLASEIVIARFDYEVPRHVVRDFYVSDLLGRKIWKIE